MYNERTMMLSAPRGFAALIILSLRLVVVASTSDGLVRIPLIPQQVQRRRLQAETGVDGLDKDAHVRPQKYYRRLSSSSNGYQQQQQQVAELYQGFGTHYVDLWCGTPRQRQTVIVDTGSGVTGFPCHECVNCGAKDYHIDGVFDQSASSSFSTPSCNECMVGSCPDKGRHADDTCAFSRHYGDGSSFTAFEAIDDCYVGGLHGTHKVTTPSHNKKHKHQPIDPAIDPWQADKFKFDLRFGCETQARGLFVTQLADGIMGLNRAPAAYWKQMYDAGVTKRQAFSLCFSRHPEASRNGTESGAMTLGGSDPRLHHDQMVFVDTSMNDGMFNVKLRQVHLRDGKGGASALSLPNDPKVVTLDIPQASMKSGRFIVDSGTTDTYLPRSFKPYFDKVFRDLSGVDYGSSVYTLTQDDLEALPTILFQLEGNEAMNKAILDQGNGSPVVGLAANIDPEHPLDVLVAMPPSHYMEAVGNGLYKARINMREPSGGVFGANTIMGHDVYFDVEGQRIGWAESTCDYTGFMEEHIPSISGKNSVRETLGRGEANASRFRNGSMTALVVCLVGGVMGMLVVGVRKLRQSRNQATTVSAQAHGLELTHIMSDDELSSFTSSHNHFCDETDAIDTSRELPP